MLGKVLRMSGGVALVAVLVSKVALDAGDAAKAPPAGLAASQTRAQQNPQAQAAGQQAARAVSLSADDRGHFLADVQINGMFIKGLVDTGATSVALPLEVARSIGVAPAPGDYNVKVNTANGETRGARVRLNEVRISTIVLRDVEGVVVEKGLSTPLIGMSFIRRLSSEMRGGTLILRQ